MSTHLDAFWFERFLAVSKNTIDTEWLQKFTRISADEQSRFYEDEIENPVFHCKGISYVSGKVELQNLQTEIENVERNEVIRDLYVRKIQNQISRVEMLAATIEGNDEVFTQKSQEVYGKPRKKYFAYIAKRMQEHLQQPLNTHQTVAAKSLESIFSKIDTSTAVTNNDVLPEPIISQDRPLSAIAIREIFLDVLQSYNIDDWKVLIDKEGTRPRFSVNPTKQVVYIPNDKVLSRRRVPLTEIGVSALAEHEIGVHVRRFNSGSQQPLLLLRIGLDNYLRGEEGIAGYVQQQIEGATEYYGFDRYLALCLAVGLDGEPRDFRALYTIMRDYYTFMFSELAAEKKLIHHTAWDVCVRVFRGSTGQGVGTVFSRDLAYFEGNIGIWELLIEQPEVYDSFFVGKYNPLLSRHIKALQALAILPK